MSALVRRWVPRGRLGWVMACAGFYTLVLVAYFGRALWRGDMIAVDDSTSEYLPQFAYPYHSWTRLLFCGYPLFADPQNMTFLPARLLLSALGAWNVFVLSGFVVAGCGALAYAYELTRDRVGALFAGLVYGVTGHLLWNLSMVPMVQSMAWAPFVFWAIERNVRSPSLGPALLGGVALACSCFGGYGQITAYTAVLAVAYAVLGLLRAAAPRRFAAHAALLFAFGALLSAAQWLPTIELLLQSQRTHMPYGQFVGWGWTFIQSAELLLSRAFLGPWSEDARSAACGLYRNADHIYLGLLPLLLGLAGAWIARRSVLTWFWALAGVFSLAIALGDHTPVARWLYHVPPYNLFRVLTRHSMFLTLGMAASSAVAIAWARSRAAEAELRRILIVSAASITLAFAGAVLAVDRHGCARWLSPGVLASGATLLVSLGTLAAWAIRPRSPWRCALLVACLALDLVSFDGWGGEQPRYAGRTLAAPSEFSAPEAAERIVRELDGARQRMWSVKGHATGRPELSVNRNLLWGVPSAAGYSPIAPTHSLDLLDMAYFGSAIGSFWKPESTALDVAAVRLVTLADGSDAPPLKDGAIRWAATDFALRLGSTRGASSSRTFYFPATEVASVELVLDMEGSARVQQGSAVAALVISGESPVRLPLIAGVDLSEWAIDCPSEHDRVQHRRASIFDARPVPLRGATCPFQRYVTSKALPEPRVASSLTLEWTGNVPEATVRIYKLTLRSAKNPAGMALDEALSELSHDPRWRAREPVSPGHLMFENQRALPRAHFVDDVLAMPLPAALESIKTGALPSGARFEPRRTALIPADARAQTTNGCSAAAVEWLDDDDGQTRLSVDLAAPCFLVLADTYYGGWSATIDERPTSILRTNFSFRGVEVPAGKHRIRFAFSSPTLLAGLAISSVSALGAALLVLRGWLRRRGRESVGVKTPDARTPAERIEATPSEAEPV